MLYILNIVIASNCLDPVNWDIRLNGTYATNRTREGRVEVYYNGEWGTVCGDDDWDDDDAEVVCRQLGYGDSGARAYQNTAYGAGPIYFAGVVCDGSEERLYQCPHRGWGSLNCYVGEDASVYCAGEW